MSIAFSQLVPEYFVDDRMHDGDDDELGFDPEWASSLMIKILSLF